ncbi:unnamed protein product [Nezara viridula]|uniref:Uncharacterized protein n=1 Tax=Nezara viridula TaxID=85310 RepID=A0A9P0H7U0_NEZVI|nr:unnamed protein product [Nezara viridula]
MERNYLPILLSPIATEQFYNSNQKLTVDLSRSTSEMKDQRRPSMVKGKAWKVGKRKMEGSGVVDSQSHGYRNCLARSRGSRSTSPFRHLSTDALFRWPRRPTETSDLSWPTGFFHDHPPWPRR